MSSSHNNSDGKGAGGKGRERSNFVNTCNLLSQFLKEKGALKDLNREISGKLEEIAKLETSQVKTAATKDLLSTIEDLNQPPTQEAKSLDNLPKPPTREAKSLDNLRKSAVELAPTSIPEESTIKASTSKEATKELKSAQMTIFYDGKIWVFEGLSTDKAGEVMLLASKGSSHWSGGNLSTSGTDNISPAAIVASSSFPPVNPSSNPGKQHVQPEIESNSSDLPIARRSSLHRFLEKRKDRATVRTPYQVHHAPASSSKSDDQQLELKL